MIDAQLRLAVYDNFVADGSAPHAGRVRGRAGPARTRTPRALLLPGTAYIWMAEPFSAVPTSFTIRAGRVVIGTACPDCGEPLDDTAGGVAHFAVPARYWWSNIGFT